MSEDDPSFFAAWLRQELRRRHGAVAEEPLPDSLLRLLQPDIVAG
jgi:hypothetical protein